MPTTCWTIVLLAGTKTEEGRAALDTLCRRYQWAVLRYLMHKGLTREDAVDVRQEFFLSLMTGSTLREPSRIKGSFGAYIRVSLNNLIRGRHRTGIKRGAGIGHDSYEDDLASPDALVFEEMCARESFEVALERAKKQFDDPKRWEAAVALLAGKTEAASVGAQLGIGPSGVRTMLMRLREDLWAALDELAADVVEEGEAKAQADRWRKALGFE